jgi:hypothetical protein
VNITGRDVILSLSKDGAEGLPPWIRQAHHDTLFSSAKVGNVISCCITNSDSSSLSLATAPRNDKTLLC